MRNATPVDSGRSTPRRTTPHPRDSQGGLRRHRSLRPVAATAVAVSLAFAGCGSGIGDALQQTVAAAQRNFLDLLLTELANSLAETSDQTAESAPDGEPDAAGEEQTDTPDESGDEVGGDGGFEELAGDAPTGAAVFVDNGCASCHCEDALGGCALDAPPLLEVGATSVDENLRGEDPHPVQVDLSDQDIVDLVAYLASLGL